MAELKKERKGIDWSKIDLNDMITDDWGYEKSIFKDKEQVKTKKPLDTRTRSKEGDLELTIKRIIKAPLIYLRFMGLSENQARIIYFSLIGVGGYFAYKKFKK